MARFGRRTGPVSTSCSGMPGTSTTSCSVGFTPVSSSTGWVRRAGRNSMSSSTTATISEPEACKPSSRRSGLRSPPQRGHDVDGALRGVSRAASRPRARALRRTHPRRASIRGRAQGLAQKGASGRRAGSGPHQEEVGIHVRSGGAVQEGSPLDGSEVLTLDRLRQSGVFNVDFVQTVLEAKPRPALRWHYFLLWQMIGLELWREIFIEGDPFRSGPPAAPEAAVEGV